MKPLTEILLRSKLQPKGEGVFEIVLQRYPTLTIEPLTYLERSYLMRTHKSCIPNIGRAEVVKTLRKHGASRAEIVSALAGQIGCTRRMIDRDFTALLSAEQEK